MIISVKESGYKSRRKAKPFTSKWRTTVANETITIPLRAGSNYDFFVDWGDGTKSRITSYSDPNRIHAYEIPGDHIIQITGIMEKCFWFNNAGDKHKIIEIIHWGDAPKVSFISIDESFFGCINLVAIAGVDNEYTSLSTLTDGLSNTFNGCTSLTQIPANIFQYSTGLLWADNTFKNCTGLLSVPSGLFKNLVNCSTFSYSFLGCTSLTTVGEDVFGPAAGSLGYIFYNCSSLTTISENAFRLCTQATAAPLTFRQTSSLVSVPENLFKYNTKITSFAETFRLSRIASVPAGLFRYNVNVTDFSGVFYSCAYLTTVPEDLFRYNTKLQGFSQTFMSSGLVSVPAGLFKYNVNVVGFSELFTSCTSLVSLPADLFKYNVLVTYFNKLCFGCSNLISVPPHLFRYNVLASVFNYSFYLCRKLVLNKNIFYADGEENTRFLNMNCDFAYTFYMSSYLGASVGEAPELWNCNFGTGTIGSTQTFRNHSLASVSNFASIPAGWK
jgi:hypothetical protein